jgi:hypothetical protein
MDTASDMGTRSGSGTKLGMDTGLGIELVWGFGRGMGMVGLLWLLRFARFLLRLGMFRWLRLLGLRTGCCRGRLRQLLCGLGLLGVG